MSYTENQILKYSGKWYFLTGILLVITVGTIVMLIDQYRFMEITGLLILSIMPVILTGLFIYISLLELSIRIDDHGVSYKLIPLFSEWRFIQSRELVSYQVNETDISTQLKFHSKNKIRWIGKDKRFIVLGKHLIVLNLVNDRSITLSTLHPEKAKLALESMMDKH